MALRLIDTHAHVNFNAFREDGDEVVRRALAAGVGMILAGSQRDTSQRAVEYAEKYPDEAVWAAVGLHPTHLVQRVVDAQETGTPFSAPQPWATFESREEVFDPEYYRGLAQHPKVVAIGEFGLDYYRLPRRNKLYQPSDRTNSIVREGAEAGTTRDEIIQKQKTTARAQLMLAMELKKPVLFHCREAHQDLRQLVDGVGFGIGRSPRGIVHSFTGTIAEAEAWLARDFLIAFNGIITFAPELEEVVRFVPLEKMVVETDSPYLAPVPFRGKRNEPLYVEYVARKIAEIKGVDLEEVAQKTTENALKITVGG